MPVLPTLTVTDEQAQRMLDAWGSVENYKQWLARQIISFVTAAEFEEQKNALLEQKRQNEASAMVDLMPAELQ